MSNIFFSDDKTAFGIKTDKGIYINTTGRPLAESEIKPHDMKCAKCGKLYRNATLRTVPHPCECGSICFVNVNEADHA